jgi:type IV secretion system protein VirB10
MVGLVWLGLGPSLIKPGAPAASDKDPEKHKAGLPDQVTALPKTYADVPQLGQPLPGDLGRPILEHARKHGAVDATGMPGDGVPVRASAAVAARTSGLFFATADKEASGAGSGAGEAVSALDRSLMALAPAPEGAAPTGQAAKVAFLDGAASVATANLIWCKYPHRPTWLWQAQ